jgi:predicted DCC family thiol-disulfide oxidoreductase YuxK
MCWSRLKILVNTPPNSQPEWILLYDGECGLCQGWVQFVLKRDRLGHIYFAALQSHWAEEALKHYGERAADLNTLYLLYRYGRFDQHCWKQSDAVLHILRLLRWPYPICSWLGYLCPRIVRDYAYQYVARSRYRWFGKVKQCILPTKTERQRFLG